MMEELNFNPLAKYKLHRFVIYIELIDRIELILFI